MKGLKRARRESSGLSVQNEVLLRSHAYLDHLVSGRLLLLGESGSLSVTTAVLPDTKVPHVVRNVLCSLQLL